MEGVVTGVHIAGLATSFWQVEKLIRALVKRVVLNRPKLFLAAKLFFAVSRGTRAFSIAIFTKSRSNFLSEIVFIPGSIFCFSYLRSKLTRIRREWRGLPLDDLGKLASFDNLTGRTKFGKKIMRILRENEINDFPALLGKYRIFSSRHFSAFGHTAFLDVYSKAVRLGILENKPSIFAGLRDDFANRELLTYFEDCLKSDFGKFEEHSDETINRVSEKLSYVQVANGQLVWFDDFACEVQRAWDARYGATPLINMTPAHIQYGETALKNRFGISRDDWFVALHLRNSKDPLRNLRDAEASSYGASVLEIISAGGRVLRIGGLDYSPKIPVRDDFFIDFSRDVKVDSVLNLYILARCRFFLGVGSGPANVSSHVFGRPIAVTNVGPMGGRIPWKNQVILPKIFLDKDTREVVALERRVSDEFGQIESRAALRSMGFDTNYNSTAEVLSLTRDMIFATQKNSFDPQVFMKHKQKQELFLDKCTDKGRLFPVYCANSILEEYDSFL